MQGDVGCTQINVHAERKTPPPKDFYKRCETSFVHLLSINHCSAGNVAFPAVAGYKNNSATQELAVYFQHQKCLSNSRPLICRARTSFPYSRLYNVFMNTYIFLRHAETEKDPSRPAVEWGLTPDALEKIQSHIKNGVFKDVGVVITSTENKAIATAKPVCELLSLSSKEIANFNEVKRGTSFLSAEEFLAQKEQQLTQLDEAFDGAESARSALERFKQGIEILDKEYENQTILIVTHGTVLSLYFAELLGEFSKVFTRWNSLSFCAVGIVKNSKVEKDII